MTEGKDLRLVFKRLIRAILAAGLISLGMEISSGQELMTERTFRVLGYGEGFFENLYYEAVDETGEPRRQYLEFAPDHKSSAYPVDDERRELTFYREVEGPRGSVSREEVGKVRLGSDWTSGLLVFLEGPDFAEAGIYEILSLPEDASDWGPGCFRFLNLSGADLQAWVGDEALLLETDLPETLCFEVENRRPLPFQLTVYWQEAEQVVFSSRLLPDKNLGKLLVIKPPLEAGSLRVRVVTIW